MGKERGSAVIYLVHADGALPNLALMRLAAYFRGQRMGVRLVRGRERDLWDPPGPVYGSSVFTFSHAKRAAIEKSWGTVIWGGTGIRTTSTLREIAPIDWENVKPDYSDYPEERASIGFTQRGCRLSCKFCVVPTKEGKPEAVHSIRDIWRGPGHSRRIILLDNDFFGQPRASWQERIRELREGHFTVNINQGINIRQVDEESARALASIEYRDRTFRRRSLYTAWDNLGEEPKFKEGIRTLAAAGIPPTHLVVYMLVGFAKGETLERILYRFNEIRATGARPYPMVYDPTRQDLKAFQRWAVRGLYRAIPWEKYLDRRLGTVGGWGKKVKETVGA